MLRGVPCNFQFTDGDLIYIENHPALVINARPTWIHVLMLFDGKAKTEHIDRERIGTFWNNIHIDYHSSVNLTPDMERLIEFLTGVSHLRR